MTSLKLRDLHRSLGASFVDRNGCEAVGSYGDFAREHRALVGACGGLDLSFRSRLVVLGADRQKVVNGQVTNNIKDLKPGEGCYAALVNAKARMLADVHVHALADELLLDLEPGLGSAVAERLTHFIVADDAQVVDASPHYGQLSLQGPRALRAVESLGWFPEVPAVPYRSALREHATLGRIYLMNQPRTGSKGFDVFVPTGTLREAAEALLEAARDQGGGPVGWEALETARIEAGIPRYLADMDETTLPPEAGLEERAISYTKGCYSGQEVIARIRTYGQVSKALRGLVIPGESESVPAPKTRLYKDGKDVGFLTSLTRSPRRGEVIALGYVRRECFGVGTEFRVGGADSPQSGRIVPLPFVGLEMAAG